MKERPISLTTGAPSLRGKRLKSIDGLTWKQRNKDAVNARRRELYAKSPEPQRQRQRAYKKGEARARILAANRVWCAAYRSRIRAEMIEAYGGACVCCGESMPQFLQLDHIYNDGAAERKVERAVAHPFWARLKKRGWPKDRYQLLCANCNFGKMINKGMCPHVA